MNSFAKLLLIGAFSVMAQGAAAQSVCHYSGKAYSAGSAVRLGETLVSCTADRNGNMRWTVDADESRAKMANCLFAGAEYSHGSLIESAGSPIVCANGRWYKEKN